jgi:CubicO group peptidase (beta-lactamase class C family)
VTSIDNPLPVDPDTLFVLGSVTKTYTATAIMRLVEQGRVELEAPVRRYVPELRLPDEEAAAQITLLNLLNHTSGLDTRMVFDSGDGDDALSREVTRMAEVALIGPVGGRASYSQLGYNLLGRVIENVTGQTYEAAVASLVLEQVGLANSVFTAGEAITRRFAVGHNLSEGVLKVAHTWKDTRGNNPGGGLVSSVSDQLRWARFHLDDGDLARRMQEPTVELVPARRGRRAHRRARRIDQRPVRQPATGSGARLRRRSSVQRRARQRAGVQPGRAPLDARTLPRRGRARPRAAPVRPTARP